MNCRKCKSEEKVKSGITRGKQRYKCKSCGYHYTGSEELGKPMEMKKQAIHMYIEGMGIRAIGRLLKVSNVAVLKWIRKASETIKEIAKLEQSKVKEVRIMELDEMYHYIQKKNSQSGCGLLQVKMTKETFSGKLVIGVK